MQYLVTLAIETDAGERSPDSWQWAELLDTPNPVGVLGCTVLPDNPDELLVERVQYFVGRAHENVGALRER